jgi:hypothetical protein
MSLSCPFKIDVTFRITIISKLNNNSKRHVNFERNKKNINLTFSITRALLAVQCYAYDLDLQVQPCLCLSQWRSLPSVCFASS